MRPKDSGKICGRWIPLENHRQFKVLLMTNPEPRNVEKVSQFFVSIVLPSPCNVRSLRMRFDCKAIFVINSFNFLI